MDVFTPAVLNRIVDDLKDKVSMFLLSMFFPEISTSTTEEIYFDVMTGKPRLSPFVSPLVEGQIVESLGYETKSFKPAYVKDKRPFEDGKAIRRRPGQPIAAPLDPMQNRLLSVIQESEDQIAMIKRRMEWMAAKAALDGKYIVEGEKYPQVLVDFGRHANLTVVLAGTARWNDSAPDPIGDLEDWGEEIATRSGATATDVVMATDVWKAFRANEEVQNLLDKKNLSPKTRFDAGPSSGMIGPQFKGYVGDFAIWTYNAEYVDDAGVTQKFLPNGKLIMGSPQMEGVQHHGSIRDEKAGFQARDFFQKSWTQEDPAVRYLMLQSAPLVVPYRPNASLGATVL
ncbi:major capsid protein [Bradyrhizobium retamae]|uniref:Capsid protein n=1 Tax=Bradyrhizobium retamae TaxID=1300035 RepID=A0A0R3M9U1_9BRAD|nr:major capsid protein [Bradyrhizobium retamae]KRR16871.1 hypothetical protein CQ13_36555 [Bradyrhizobium retamae]